MLQEFQLSRKVKSAPKQHVQKSSAINTTSWLFLDPGPVVFTDCFIATPAALCSWKFGTAKGVGCAFSTWEISDNFSPSSSFGLLSKLGNSLVSKFWRRSAHRQVSICLKEQHGGAAVDKGCLCCSYWEVQRAWLCVPGGIFLAVRWLLANLALLSCPAIEDCSKDGLACTASSWGLGFLTFPKWHLASGGKATWTTTVIFLMNTRAEPTVLTQPRVNALAS